MSAVTLSKPTPYQPQAQAESNLLPSEFANHRFTDVHYPGGWVFDDDAGFLPALSQIIAKPGVNGVDKTGNLNKAIAGALQKGGLTINPADARLGEFRNYIAYYGCVGGGRRYGMVWDVYKILPGGEARQQDTGAKRRELLIHLRDSGMIHPLESPVYERMLDIEMRSIRRLAKQAGGNPYLLDQLSRREKRVAAMRQAWVDYCETQEPIGEPGGQDASSEMAAILAGAGAGPAKPKGGRKVTVRDAAQGDA